MRGAALKDGVLMTRLTICRGLPGSGKTHYALDEIARHGRGRIAKISRDDHRRHVFDTEYRSDPKFEDLVTVLQHAAITIALQQGVRVICDDTNLDPVHVEKLMRLARDAGADWEIRDFTDVPLDVCIQRDWDRSRRHYVGESVIRDMYERFIAPYPRGVPLPVPELI